MARLGILGGTFNPPHVGHLLCAQEARVRLDLDAVLLMPVASPPHKPLRDDPGPERRLEMCRLAAAEEDWLEASDLEVSRGGPSYTVDTLEALHDSHPEDELTWIAGGDMALSLPAWRDPERVLSLARFAVAERGEARRADIERALAGLEGRHSVVFFEMPRIDVSSSTVRDRVAAGLPVRWLVPDAVGAYVREHGLYGSAVTA
ncbi:MAG: nicotinate-nucleotide adenylyltransferase [Solirubrobacteraceae bacterium]|nr:nicotinate-nucleotide adenylyltransferase [Solirubrobacteraceae bacterium]